MDFRSIEGRLKGATDNPAAKWLSVATGIAAFVLTLLTDHETGVIRVLPYWLGILANGAYVGWGGFQKEGEEWDFGLVLKPSCFGLGLRIARLALAFAIADERIPYVALLLPPSRKKLAALARLGAAFVCEVDYDGARFLKYRLATS